MIHHPNLLLCTGLSTNGKVVYSILEQMQMDLRAFLKASISAGQNSNSGTASMSSSGSRDGHYAGLSFLQKCELSKEMAKGLAWLHNSTPNPIVHGSLKPANILVRK
jgi:serine/threonine protein kinase